MIIPLFLSQVFDRALGTILKRVEIALGFNSSEIKLSHIRQISTLANLNSDNLFVIDAGANIGEFTEVILRFQSAAKIICIEPQNMLVKLLKSKFESSNVQVLALGLGTSNSVAPLYFQTEGDRKASLSDQRAQQNFQMVTIQTLSEILVTNKISKLDILKLDLEGMDVPVLQTYFRDSLGPKPEVIILEVSYLANIYGFTPQKTFELLVQNGYKRIFRTSPLFSLIQVKGNQVHDYSGHTVNWVAIQG
jgi:FkbM family methyltransferase